MSGKFGNFVEMIRISLLPSYAARVSHDYWEAQERSHQERSHIERSAREWERFLAEIDERLALLPDDTVLDYGCGNGEIAQHLLQNGFKVSGCDISGKLMDQARERGVVGPEELSRSTPDLVVIMNPVYEKEIGRDLADMDISAEVVSV